MALGERAANGPIQREMASKSKVRQTVASGVPFVAVISAPQP
jgi:hypothetical protein